MEEGVPLRIKRKELTPPYTERRRNPMYTGKRGTLMYKGRRQQRQQIALN